MTHHDHAPAPMALDEASLAGSAHDAAPSPLDLGALDAQGGAPSPAALDLIGGVDEAAPAPDPSMGQGEMSAAVAAGIDAAPAPTQGEPPDVGRVAAGGPAPMDIDQLYALEQR